MPQTPTTTKIQLLQQRRYHKCIRLACPSTTVQSILEFDQEYQQNHGEDGTDSQLEVLITIGGLTKTNPLNLIEMLFFSRIAPTDFDLDFTSHRIRVHKRVTKRLGPQCFHHCAVKYKSSILLIGGHTISKFRKRILDNVLEFNLISNKWRRWGKLGGEHPIVAGHTAVIVGGESERDEDEFSQDSAGNEAIILVFAGENNRSQCQNDLWILQSSTQVWKRIECLEKPSPRWLHTAIVTQSAIDGAQMWVFGGDNSVSKNKTLSTDHSETALHENIMDDLWCFSLDTLKWKCITKPVNSTQLIEADREDLTARDAFLGVESSAHIPPHQHSPRHFTSSFRLWPSARHSHAACYFEGMCDNGDVIEPCMLIFGGYTGQQSGSQNVNQSPPIPYSNELLRYDFASNTWHRFTWRDTPPKPLSSHDMQVDGSTILVFGGFDGQSDLKCIYRILFSNLSEAYVEDFDSVLLTQTHEQDSSDDSYFLPHTPIPTQSTVNYPSLDDISNFSDQTLQQRTLNVLPSRKTYKISSLSSTAPIRMETFAEHSQQKAVHDTSISQKLREEMISIRNINTRLENEISQLRLQLRDKEAQLTIADEESMQILHRLDEETQNNEHLQKQLQSYKNEVDARVDQEQDLVRRIREKDASLKLLKEKVEEYTEKLSKLERDSQAKIEDQEDEIHELQRELRDNQAKMIELAQLSEQQEEDIQNYRAALSGSSIASPRQQHASAELTDSLKMQIHNLELQQKMLTAELHSKSAQVEELTKKLERSKAKSADRDTLANEKLQAEERMKYMELQLDSLRQLLFEQKQETRKAKEKSRKMHRKYSKQKRKHQEELDTTKSHISMLVHLILKSQDLPSHTKANIFRQLQTWKLDGKLIEEKEFLGSGSFGAVFRGYYSKQEVAIKIIKGESLGLGRAMMHDKVLKEVLIMRSVNHENILQCHGCDFGEDDAKIVLEYCPMNLSQLLRRQELSAAQKLSLIQQLAAGLEVLHANKIKHRDLKPQNVLIQEDKKAPDETQRYVVKICDFGESIMQTMARTLVGSVGYCAPEVYLQLAYDERVDIYSFGITCFEIWVQENPFKRFMEEHQHVRNADQLFRIIVEEEVRPDLRDARLRDMPKELVNLMQACWHSNPLNRPQGMTEVRRVLSECTTGEEGIEVEDE